MARGHWLDPFARSLLEATGQLPRRPRPPKAAAEPANNPHASLQAAAFAEAVEADLLALKRSQATAAAAGPPIDVNRASADDWLRLPGISTAQVDLLLRLQQGGVQLSGPDDLQRLLELSHQQLAAWEPLLQFHWYSEAPLAAARPGRLDLNQATAAALEQRLPQLSSDRRRRLLWERQRAPFQDLADLQQRLQLPPAVVEELIGRVRFGRPAAGPQLPRSA